MTILGIIVFSDYWLGPYVKGTKIETAHYTIYSTSPQPQTVRVGEAAECLYSAYTTFFKGLIDTKAHDQRLKMMLYRDKQEFIRHNKSKPWAEAYYKAPYCYSYYPEGETNPYHWMLHEAIHQLNNEVAHFRIPQWIDEGLADYFGSSRIEVGKLLPGQIAFDSYPIWWLSSLSLTGNISQDIKDGKVIPLTALITGIGGPDIDRHFNLYYIHWWSLTHFLFHYKDGTYSRGYKKLIKAGGTVEGFETNIGSINKIQAEWYEYLRQTISEASSMKR